MLMTPGGRPAGWAADAGVADADVADAGVLAVGTAEESVMRCPEGSE
jgi:hypothetical protein